MANSIWPMAGIIGVAFIVAAAAIIVAYKFRNAGPIDAQSQDEEKEPEKIQVKTEKKKTTRNDEDGDCEPIVNQASRGKYKKNPEFSLLHPSQKKALNIGVIDGEAAGFYCNSLTTGVSLEELERELAEHFNIGSDKKPAKIIINQLFTQGCREYFDRFKRDFVFTEDRLWEEKTKEWFIEPNAANACVSYMCKLDQTISILIQAGYLKDRNEIQQKNIIAWDLSRVVYVTRSCAECGYITQEEAWSVINAAFKTAQNHYQDWKSYADGYVIGRAMQEGEDSSLQGILDIVSGLLKDEDSPWHISDFK